MVVHDEMVGADPLETVGQWTGESDSSRSEPHHRTPGPFSRGRDAPRQVGRFLLLQRLGAGGGGSVHAGYDPALDRKVAVKILRRMNETARARVIREAQAMAKLAHPNVVAVYEVGEQSGVLYIAMQHVEGSDLQRWQKTRPHWRTVLQAYRQAGEGLIAAHEAGIIHRDFKPENAMIARAASRSGPPGSSPASLPPDAVKVVDFGIALAHELISSEPEESDTDDVAAPRLTVQGRVVGTPAYMAPEQWLHSDVGAAADQFSFCVSLWEGLYGRLPFAGDTLDELARAVRGGTPPVPPPQSPVPSWVARILLRGLSVAPSDRWPSMRALLDALRHDSVRRRRRRFMMAAGVAAMGIAGWGLQTQSEPQSTACRGAAQRIAPAWTAGPRERVEEAMLATAIPYASRAWDQTARTLDGWTERWAATHEAVCTATTLRGEASEAVMDVRMACLARARSSLEATVRVLAEPDPSVVHSVHHIVADLPDPAACGSLDAERATASPPRSVASQTLIADVEALLSASRLDPARDRLVDARAIDAEGRPMSDDPEVLMLAARLHDARGRFDLAEGAAIRAMDAATQHGDLQTMRGATSFLLGVVGYRQRRMDEALEKYRDLAFRLAEDDPRAQADVRVHLAHIMLAQARHDAAETEYRRALTLREQSLGADHPVVVTSRSAIANLLEAQGRYAEAEALDRQVLDQRLALHGERHPSVADTLNNLANVIERQDRYEEAEALHRRALDIRLHVFGPDHIDVASSRANLASTLSLRGRHEEAEVEQRLALQIFEANSGEHGVDAATLRHNLANVLKQRGKLAEAEQELRRALTTWEEIFGAEHPHVATARFNLARLLVEQERYPEAEAEFRRALQIQAAALGATHPMVDLTRSDLANLLLALGRPAEALVLAELAWTRHGSEGASSTDRARTAFVLARARWETDSSPAGRTEAIALAQTALLLHRELGDHEKIERLRAWLSAHPVE